MKLLVYSPKITSRLRYIFNLVFRDVLLINPDFTSNPEEFINYGGHKISYGEFPLKDELFFKSSSFLFENRIQPASCDYKNLSADFFSLAFFLVSRYEEYLPFKPDSNGRFDPRDSMAFKKNFLQKPTVNIGALKIKEEISKKFPDFIFPDFKFRFIPTIDIDNAYAYCEKGFVRTFGAYTRSLLKADFTDIAERTNVLVGKKRDPYDVFDYLITLQKEKGFNPIFFILLADYGMNDKNVPHTSKKFQSLLKGISDYAEVGIHPSYNSSQNKELLKTEVSRLSGILNKEITKSRQHFLKLSLPETYRNLLQLGITDDFTMGYASEQGFRAGICTPYFFYDLLNEAETALKIHPFCLMEGTFKYYKRIPAHKALDEMKPIVDEVKNVHGTLYTLWHNEFFSNEEEFKGWRKVFEELVDYAGF